MPSALRPTHAQGHTLATRGPLLVPPPPPSPRPAASVPCVPAATPDLRRHLSPVRGRLGRCRLWPREQRCCGEWRAGGRVDVGALLRHRPPAGASGVSVGGKDLSAGAPDPRAGPQRRRPASGPRALLSSLDKAAGRCWTPSGPRTEFQSFWREFSDNSLWFSFIFSWSIIL